MISTKVKALLEQIENPAAESILRAASAAIVDGALETLCTYVIELERTNRRLEILFHQIDQVLSKGGNDGQ